MNRNRPTRRSRIEKGEIILRPHNYSSPTLLIPALIHISLIPLILHLTTPNHEIPRIEPLQQANLPALKLARRRRQHALASLQHRSQLFKQLLGELDVLDTRTLGLPGQERSP